MLGRQLRDWLIGPPLPTFRLQAEKLDTTRALAALSPDALSSIAYANQEIFLGLVAAGAAGLAYALPIALAIAGLLVILTLSYSQTIQAYPQGGGSYTVASENLGTWPGLVAAAALLIDYVLTAAVSLTAGVAALTSASPALMPYRIELALLLLLVITIANLRGVQESGTLMAVPVYLFVAVYLGLVGVGLYRAWTEGPGAYPAAPVQTTVLGVSLILILHTFASGCTALTGIEAISNAVPIFRPPEIKRALRAMRSMAILMALLFLGTVGLTQYFAVLPASGETVLSAFAHRVVGSGGLYFLVQISTLLILLVAANTSFAGFPRVVSILAKDGYLPRQLALLGDRLVYSNGMLLLSGLAAVLIMAFGGDTHALIPLFAVGVFIAFTLSQTGMVLHWIQERQTTWQLKAALNGLGALTTLLAFIVIATSKFLEGAWIVAVLIVLILLVFRSVKHHYNEIASELTMRGLHHELKSLPEPRVVIPIPGVHRGVVYALRYARAISSKVTAVYVEIDPEQTEKVRRQWQMWGMGVPLEIVPSPYRSLIGPFLDYLDKTDSEHHDGQLATVILPEFIPAKWWENFLHNQAAWLLKLALLYRRRRFGKVRAIIDVPTHLRH